MTARAAVGTLGALAGVATRLAVRALGRALLGSEATLLHGTTVEGKTLGSKTCALDHLGLMSSELHGSTDDTLTSAKLGDVALAGTRALVALAV